MSGEIADQCRQYVAENAASCDGQSEDDAVASMILKLRNHAKSLGWDTLEYHINVDDIARKGLMQHRG